MRSPLVVVMHRTMASPPVTATWHWLRPGLRILTYHDVPRPAALAAQLDVLAERYVTVSGADVIAARDSGRSLPSRALWITFDDGDPTVVHDAQPLLRERSMTATVFVCPGLIESGRRTWWSIVSLAGESGRGAEIDGRLLAGPALVEALKRVPDLQRREVVDELERHIAEPADPVQLSVAELRDWQDAGMEVGNHTWDHPCLDTCTETEQTRQITVAHDWILANLAPQHALFAYPSGKATDHARNVLLGLDYDLILRFDHRVNPRRALQPGTRELTRLWLDSEAEAIRALEVASGVHADALHVAWKLRDLTRGSKKAATPSPA